MLAGAAGRQISPKGLSPADMAFVALQAVSVAMTTGASLHDVIMSDGGFLLTSASSI